MTFGGRGILSAAELDVRFGYAGYRWDGTIGKYHVRNRVYDPYAGRWLNRDPIEYSTGTTNLYEYAVAAPLDFIDPNGLYPYDGLSPGDHIFPGTPGKPKKKIRKETYKTPDDHWMVPWKEFQTEDELFEELDKLQRPADADQWILCISSHGQKGWPGGPSGGGPYIRPGDGSAPHRLLDPETLTDDQIDILSKFDGILLWCCNGAFSDVPSGLADRTGKPVWSPDERVLSPALLPEDPDHWTIPKLNPGDSPLPPPPPSPPTSCGPHWCPRA